MQVRDARAAEPVQLLGAAAATVMPKERVVVLVEYFPADTPWVPRPRMWSFTGRHPEERYSSWDNQVTERECARLCAVRCGGWCDGSFPGVAVCQCVWLVAGLHGLVMDEEVVISTAVVVGLLCFLGVQLDAVLQLCVCPLVGGELHVTYCGFRFRDVLGLQSWSGTSPLSTASLISGCRIRRWTSFVGAAVGPHPACCAMVSSGVQVARWAPP